MLQQTRKTLRGEREEKRLGRFIQTTDGALHEMSRRNSFTLACLRFFFNSHKEKKLIYVSSFVSDRIDRLISLGTLVHRTFFFGSLLYTSHARRVKWVASLGHGEKMTGPTNRYDVYMCVLARTNKNPIRSDTDTGKRVKRKFHLQHWKGSSARRTGICKHSNNHNNNNNFQPLIRKDWRRKRRERRNSDSSKTSCSWSSHSHQKEKEKRREKWTENMKSVRHSATYIHIFMTTIDLFLAIGDY